MVFRRPRAAGLLAKRSLAMIIVGLLVLGPVAAAQDWQPTRPPNTSRVNNSEWTVTEESREYTTEDGTRVTEHKTTTVKKTDGKTEYTESETTKTETKGDTATRTRTKERTDSKGNKTTIEQRSRTEKIPGGTRRTFEHKENGKTVMSSTSTSYDPPRGDGVVLEEENISYDQNGNPVKKTKYRHLSNGTILIDEYLWDPKTGTWGPSTGTRVVELKASRLVAPSATSAGYAVGGTVRTEGVTQTAVGTVVAESPEGKKVEVQPDPRGRWVLPAGLLTAGTWLLRTRMPDGKVGEPTPLQVLSETRPPLGPTVTSAPDLAFTGGDTVVTGTNLVAAGSSNPPAVWLAGQSGDVSVDPVAFSDHEVVFEMPHHAPVGDVNCLVYSGEGFSNPVDVNVASLQILLPRVTKVGQEFVATVELAGLSGENLKREFSAVVSVVGPARFVEKDGKEMVVTLREGVAQVKMIAEAPGEFNLFVTLRELPTAPEPYNPSSWP